MNEMKYLRVNSLDLQSKINGVANSRDDVSHTPCTRNCAILSKNSSVFCSYWRRSTCTEPTDQWRRRHYQSNITLHEDQLRGPMLFLAFVDLDIEIKIRDLSGVRTWPRKTSKFFRISIILHLNGSTCQNYSRRSSVTRISTKDPLHTTSAP